nr:hypothetical protein [Tanacetum cinerariifolium]
MIQVFRINVPLVDVLARMPNYVKFLKELISNKHEIEQFFAAFFSDESSTMIQNKVLPKLGDPKSFLIPCNLNKTFSCNPLADLDKGSKILHSIEGTILEEEIFSEFDNFITMAANENYDSESDEEKAKFEKITNIDYKIKTSLEEPLTDLELKPLPDNLEYVFLEEPYFFLMIRRCVSGLETRTILDLCQHEPTGGHYGPNVTAKKGIDFMGPFLKSHKFEYILVAVDYVSKWAEAQALPTNDARVVITFLKKLFCRFRMPKDLISDRGTHFCNKIMEKTMKRYGVSHHFSTSYHPQTSGQVENTNKALKRILEKTVKDNPAIWSRKLNDALWAFHTAYKTPTFTTPYKLIYGKNCHLPFEIEHRAYWALKNYNPDLIVAGEK